MGHALPARAWLAGRRCAYLAALGRHAARTASSLHAAWAGEGGHLYGSVTGAMIAEGLRKQGIAVEDSAVQLENPIKELGIYQVAVRLHAEVTGLAKVYVVPPPPEKGEADSKRK